jgi:excisionase family DNA binding protein
MTLATSPPLSGQTLLATETCSVDVAAARLGLSRGKAYELARRNELPVPVLRFGRKLAIPTRTLDRVLGIEDEPPRAEQGPGYMWPPSRRPSRKPNCTG